MKDGAKDAIRIAEKLLQRADAISGAAVAIAAAKRDGIREEEIYQLLDVIAGDVRRNAELLVELLSSSSTQEA